MIDQPLRIVGAPGSPYSRKLRAVLRYRRIPFAWINQGSPESRGLPQPRVRLLPQLILPGPDGTLEARTDSTPLIRELEKPYPGRSVIPPDRALAFIESPSGRRRTGSSSSTRIRPSASTCRRRTLKGCAS